MKLEEFVKNKKELLSPKYHRIFYGDIQKKVLIRSKN